VEQKDHHLFGVYDLLDYEEADIISLETLLTLAVNSKCLER